MNERINLVGKSNLVFEIEYVHFTIAKSLQGVIEEWAQLVGPKPKSSIISKIEKNKNAIRNVLTDVLILCFMLMPILYTQGIIGSGEIRFEEGAPILSFITFYIFYIFLSVMVARYSSSFMTKSISALFQVSSINITQGDIRAIDNHKRLKKSGFWSTASSVAIILLYGFISSIAASYFLEYIKSR